MSRVFSKLKFTTAGWSCSSHLNIIRKAKTSCVPTQRITHSVFCQANTDILMSVLRKFLPLPWRRMAPCSPSCRDREQSLPVSLKWREYFKMSAWQSLMNWPFISQQWHFATYPEVLQKVTLDVPLLGDERPRKFRADNGLSKLEENWQPNPLAVAPHCGYKHTVTMP